jgi:hypothetical protein
MKKMIKGYKQTPPEAHMKLPHIPARNFLSAPHRLLTSPRAASSLLLTASSHPCVSSSLACTAVVALILLTDQTKEDPRQHRLLTSLRKLLPS